MKTSCISIKPILLLVLLVAALGPQISTFAQDTAFTYQGHLTTGTNAANGLFDLRFAVFDAATGGGIQGASLTNAATAVSNGFFTVVLDFGNVFPGAERWLEIGVRTYTGGPYITLTPRQQVTAAPYSVTAGNLSGMLPASQIIGPLPPGALSGNYTNPVIFNSVLTASGGLIIETRTNDPAGPVAGRIWLRTDL